jgi:hypothetical protein
MSSEQLRNRSEEPNLRATAAVLPAFLPGAGIVASAIGPHGSRYGTASQGGTNGYGVVWAFTNTNANSHSCSTWNKVVATSWNI